MDRALLAEAVQASRSEKPKGFDEAGYLNCWRTHLAGVDDEFLRAAIGGVFADRLAWVFVAGYQSAIRKAFAHKPSRWLAYLASEDRSGELPGVRMIQTDGQKRLTGWKTWVAAADRVGELIVRVNVEPAEYYLVSREAEGVQISSRSDLSFLADLSQGAAEFSGALVERQLQPADGIAFNFREALAIYAALCGYVLTQPEMGRAAEDALNLLEAGARIWVSFSDSADLEALKAYDQQFQSFVGAIEGDLTTRVPEWDRDRRLLSMYSKGIERYRE